MKRSLILGAALALAAGAALAGDLRYLVYGDSVSAGTSWPANCGICPVIFDCTGGCDDNTQVTRDKCGHARRLDAWLGAGYYVKNEGIGGEDTAQALTRMPMEMSNNCAGSPGDCVAVLLMHGTNDMNSAVSPESARNNLSAMIDIAKDSNVDVLLMSIVRKVYDTNNTKWSAYRDLVQTLAGTKNLQFVDPHGPLCDDNWTCYNLNYWVDQCDPGFMCSPVVSQGTDCTDYGDREGDNNLGHLDPDGYDVLTDLIKAAFPAAVPAAPSPTSPMGNITDTTPDFVWPNVATARWYRLDVDGALTWWEGAAICSGGTCTANPGITLAEGSHSWRVQGRNLRGPGSFSAGKSFSVVTDPPPAPTPLGPTGDHFEHAPRYDWLEEPTATMYDVLVEDSGGGTAYQATSLSASAVCSGGVCSHVGSILASPDVYVFQVRGRNAGGPGPYSSPGVEFTILECEDDTPMDLHDVEPSPVVAPPKEVVYCGALSAPVSRSTYTVEPSGNLSIHTRDGFTGFDGFSVNPGGELTIRSP